MSDRSLSQIIYKYYISINNVDWQFYGRNFVLEKARFFVLSLSLKTVPYHDYKFKLQPMYRFDELNLSIHIKFDMDMYQYIESLGYELRVPEKKEKIRKARFFDSNNALMIRIDGHWFTINFRYNKNPSDDIYYMNQALLVLSGYDMDCVNLRKLLQNFDGYSKATRIDVTSDLVSKVSGEDENTKKDFFDTEPGKMQLKLLNLAGFNSNYYGGNKQNPENFITAGNMNSHSPIKRASKNNSNGATLYIGSMRSKFMGRIYDKSAEVKKRTDKKIPPTLRVEYQTKKEISDAIRKYIIKSSSRCKIVAKNVFQSVADDYLTLANKSMKDVLQISHARLAKLDYSYLENPKWTTDKWLDVEVMPAIIKAFPDATEKQLLEYLSKHLHKAYKR